MPSFLASVLPLALAISLLMPGILAAPTSSSPSQASFEVIQPRPQSIAVFLGSTRPVRTSPAIGNFLLAHLGPLLPSNITLNTLDLADFPLPHFSSSFSPKTLPPLNPHLGQPVPVVREFSLAVQRHDAFVFVIPEYNAGFPGEVKNSLDHLWSEWVGKPAVVVSYSSGGGNRAGEALRKILVDGFKMRVVGKVGLPVAWSIGGRGKAKNGALVEGQAEKWVEDGFGSQLDDALEGIVQLLGAA